jgi:hypothetical protein
MMMTGVRRPRDDDGDLVIGNRAMAAFATSEGFPVSTSSMQKYTSPAVNSGPEIVGLYGRLPASTKGLIRQWCRSRIHPRHARRVAPAAQMEVAE